MPDYQPLFRRIESYNFATAENDWLLLLQADPRTILSRALDCQDPNILRLYAQALYTIFENRAQGTPHE